MSCDERFTSGVNAYRDTLTLKRWKGNALVSKFSFVAVLN